MDSNPRLARSARLLLFLFFAATLLPRSAAAQQQLSVSPTSVNVQATVRTNAATQTVQIRNAGKGALKWSLVPPSGGWPTWLTVSPASGTNSGTLTLTFKTSTLSAGTVNTSFKVQAAQAGTPGSPATVGVQVTMVPAATLTITCPTNKTVASPNGSPVAVTYSATTSGGAPPVTVTGTPPSGSSFPVGTTTVQVTAQSTDGQTASCSFSVTVTYTAAPLTLACPASPTVASPDGSAVVVTYSATASGGVPPVTVTGNPPSGSTFAVGTTPVQVSAQSSDGQTASCGFSVTVTYSPAGVGAQPTITCPVGSVDIFPGTSIPTIQGLIDGSSGATTFCFRAGVHAVLASIVPKTGNTFIGEYGAVLDGTGWTTTNDTDAAFRVYSQDIDFVTIRNLVFRNLRRGIHAGYPYTTPGPDHWTIEYNEFGPNYAGMEFPSDSSIRNNYFHHNSNRAFIGEHAHNSILEGNEISYNGWETKIGQSNNVTFRNNFIHHNDGTGIWYDTDNTNSLVEGNRVEDNGWIGIFYEISGDGIIRNNTIRRNGDAGVFLGTSKNTQIYNNIIDSNLRGITYFFNCASVGNGAISYDLTNNTSHDNTITVGSQSGAWATNFDYWSTCTDAQVAPYKNGQKNLTFTNNTYDVPLPATGQYWYWAGFYTWAGWQALGFDTTGTVK
jgi:parallel beta-helix repeat protein